MTITRPPLAECGQLDITVYEDTAALIAELTDELIEANKEIAMAEVGVIWYFQLGPDESAPALAFGIHGEVGALAWYHGHEAFVPANGGNAESLDYWSCLGYEVVMPAHSEIPIEQAYAALAELITTRQRPTCVEWREEGGA